MRIDHRLPALISGLGPAKPCFDGRASCRRQAQLGTRKRTPSGSLLSVRRVVEDPETPNPDSEPEERGSRPHVTLDKAAWRAAAVAAVVISVGLAGALVAQTSLAEGADSTQADGLTTLALVLAVLAFLVQIFVYVFQTNASNAAVQRSDALTRRTQALLDEIRATSRSTERVLAAQFDRLLDYVVADRRPGVREATDQAADDSSSDEPQEPPATSDPQSQAMSEWLYAAPRPRFFGDPPPGRSASQEDQRVAAYLRAWPDRDEAAELIPRLRSLSPLALTKLKRYVDTEIRQRREGRPVGLTKADDGSISASSAQLIDAGLVRDAGDRFTLTDQGRQVARLIATPKGGPTPDWFDEVAASLLQPPKPEQRGRT